MRLASACLGQVLLSLPLLSAPGALAAEPRGGFSIVVHPTSPVNRVSRAELADIFLGNKTRWAGGESIEPVDLSATSPTRAAFSAAILGLPVGEVVRHRQRMVFSGRLLPARVKLSDAEVVAYVASRANAIGYVSSSADVGGLKVVAVD